MILDVIQNLNTRDDNLIRLINQLNLLVRSINTWTASTDAAIGVLEDDSFAVSQILVNSDGDVVTNSSGEVLLGRS